MEDRTRNEKEIPNEDPALTDLIRRIVGGDPYAMAGLYEATNRMLYGLVVKILPDRNAAEEVLLDAYSHVWRRAEDYSPKSGGVMTWLVSLVRLRALDRLRAGRMAQPRMEFAEPAMENSGATQAATPSPISIELRSGIRSALDSISPEQRQVIELAYFSGLSYSEIAARLGQPSAAVKTRARLGMIKINDLLRSTIDGR